MPLAFWSFALLAGPVDVVWVGGNSPLSVWPLTLATPLCWPGRGLSVWLSQLTRCSTEVVSGGEAASVWKVVDCVEMDLLHPHRKWAVWLWWGCGGMLLTLLCSFWCCLLFVDFRWLVEISWRTGINRKVSCGCVLAPLFPSQLPVHWSKCTLLSLAATALLQQTWKLLVIFMDVLRVVYKVICAPPPISLVLHLKLSCVTTLK